MISFAEFNRILSEAADEMPPDFFTGLNGGIRLMPEWKMHPEAVHGNLYILGEYHFDSVMGRNIVLYYGSFMRTYGNLDGNLLRERITHTLKHEFRHHLESMGGTKELEIEDRNQIDQYREKYRPDEQQDKKG
jgi:predicted Zn-dependent protease with MMP-like domain